MYSDNKQIRDVADAAAKIMYGQQTVTEKLHPNQQQLDVHEPEKDELTSDDFKKLRAKKEVKKEEVEQMDEVKMADLPSTRVQGRSYGTSKPEPHAVDVMKGPKEKELKDIEAEKKKKQKKFSEMVNLYQEKGLKSLSEMLVKEEPDNEQFTKELEDAKAKSEGKKKSDGVGKAAPMSTASISEEVEQIEEKHMTDAEMEKREDIVKSMKKGMAGFKDRYGDRAKDVMYATATKQAMK